MSQYLLFECVIESGRDNLLGVGTLEEMAHLVPEHDDRLCDQILEVLCHEMQYKTDSHLYTLIPWNEGPVRLEAIPYFRAIDQGLRGHYLLLQEYHDEEKLDFWEYESQAEAEQKFLEGGEMVSVVMWGISVC